MKPSIQKSLFRSLFPLTFGLIIFVAFQNCSETINDVPGTGNSGTDTGSQNSNIRLEYANTPGGEVVIADHFMELDMNLPAFLTLKGPNGLVVGCISPIIEGSDVCAGPNPTMTEIGLITNGTFQKNDGLIYQIYYGMAFTLHVQYDNKPETRKVFRIRVKPPHMSANVDPNTVYSWMSSDAAGRTRLATTIPAQVEVPAAMPSYSHLFNPTGRDLEICIKSGDTSGNTSSCQWATLAMTNQGSVQGHTYNFNQVGFPAGNYRIFVRYKDTGGIIPSAGYILRVIQ